MILQTRWRRHPVRACYAGNVYVFKINTSFAPSRLCVKNLSQRREEINPYRGPLYIKNMTLIVR